VKCNPKGVERQPGQPDPAFTVALTADRVAAWRQRMETKACEVARAVGFSNSAPRGQMFERSYDPNTRAWYETGRFEWARGTVRVDSRTLDVQIERRP
jgi:hypothetical protein